jgi:hypothetical protein
MSQNDFDNVRITDINGLVKLYTNGDLSIGLKGSTSTTQHQMLIQATDNTNGALYLTSGVGGITLDSTVGSGSSLSQPGPIFLISKAASSWNVNSGNLSLLTTSSGNILVDSAGNSSFDSVGTTSIASNGSSSWTNTGGDLTLSTVGGTNISLSSTGDVNINGLTGVNIGTNTTNTDVNIGHAGCVNTVNGTSTFNGSVTMNGNLTVEGTFTTINTETIDIGINYININSDINNTILDAGLIINQTPSFTGISPGITSLTTAATNNKFVLSATDTITAANSVVEVLSPLMVGQTRTILSIASSVATLTSAWTPVALTGTSFVVSGSSGSMILTGTGTNFTSELAGACISLTISAVTQLYVVHSVTSTTLLSLNNANLTTGTSSTASIIQPGNVDYISFNGGTQAFFYDASNSEFAFASTASNPGSGNINILAYSNIHANNAIFNSITIEGTNPELYTGSSWSGGVFTPGTLSGGCLTLEGGFGVGNNIICSANAEGSINGPLVDLYQTGTGGVGTFPVLSLTQADNVQPFLTLTAASVASGTGPNTLITKATQTITQAGFLRVVVNDKAASPNLTAASYYIPLLTLT